MELKRILARNARAANEKAIAQYGPDVLVISSSQVNGLTELIVAVDLPALTTEEAEPFLKTEFANASNKEPASKFDVLLGKTLEDNKRQARERQATQVAKPIIQVNAKAEPVKAKVTAQPAVKAQASEAEQEIRAHEMVRGREIVELVREELASLRREFKLSQQMASWQGNMPLPAALTPLRDALNDAPIPVALRALLIDSIKDHDNLADAKLALQNQLTHAVEQEQLAMPSHGVHVLVGPSGAGKSLMVARLAQAASLAHGSEKVMVISYHDQRAGAWNQTQLLSAQSGVDCFRAINIGTLKLLLEEHANRRLILIDTSGVQMQERLNEMRGLQQDMGFHAVVPADASAATLRRIFANTNNLWSSLMLSKLDESHQPWALLQFLTEKTLPVSVASQGEHTSDLVEFVAMVDLVKRALDNLDLPENNTDAESAHASALGALTVDKLQKIAAHYQTESTGLTHE
jgi:flagellar biosynthesis protein FlhF